MSISSITSNALNAWGITPSTLSAGGALAATSAASAATGANSPASGGTTSLLGSLANDIQAMLVQFQNDATAGANGAASATAGDAQRQTSHAGAYHGHHHHGRVLGGLESAAGTAASASLTI